MEIAQSSAMEQAGNVTNTVVEKSGPSTRRESLETGFSTFEKNSTLIPTSSDLYLARRTPREGIEYNTSISSLQIGTGASRSRNKTLDLVTWFGLPQTEVSGRGFNCLVHVLSQAHSWMSIKANVFATAALSLHAGPC